VFVERLWRTVKYEEVYIKDYEDAWQAESNLRDFFEFYCYGRRHQSLDKQTPAEVYGVQRMKRSTRRATNNPR
jgi:putative transposase